jgi:hypothetical protein
MLRETGHSSVSLAVSTHTCGNRPASQNPPPTPIPGSHSKDFAIQIETRHNLRFHRPKLIPLISTPPAVTSVLLTMNTRFRKAFEVLGQAADSLRWSWSALLNRSYSNSALARRASTGSSMPDWPAASSCFSESASLRPPNMALLDLRP